MIHFLKLIRVQNLFIVAFTQILMRYAVINPILKVNDFTLQFSDFNFFLLVLATLSLTAAGYVINDYFDTKTDLVNNPNKVIVGRNISRRATMTIHLVLNIIGVLLGFYISFYIGLYQLGFIFLLVTGILWYYSTTYKRQFLIGNIIVALLTAIVPLMVVLYEIPVLNKTYREFLINNKLDFNNIFAWVAGFSFFAFISTLSREIIKDIEDFEGDTAYGRNTLPIIMGVKWSKIIVISLNVILIVSIIFVYFRYLTDTLTLWYFIIGVIIPSIILIITILKSSIKKHYTLASNLSKIIMLIGISYSFLVYYIFTNTF